MTNSVRVTDIPSASAADEFIVLRDDGTGMALRRVSATSISAQLSISSGVAKKTWADLDAIVGAFDGQRAEVHGDIGSHIDPVSGFSVANTGVYGWYSSPGRWARLSDLDIISVENQIATTNAALTAEVAARTSAVATARDYAIATARSAVEAELIQSRSRPADAKLHFTPQSAGAPETVTTISAGNIAINVDGRSYRIIGASIVSLKAPIWLPQNLTFRVRAYYRRAIDPADPNNDAVIVGVAWLDKAFALISTQIVVTDGTCTVAAGLRVQSFNLPTPPGGAVYARPFIETFGSTCQTDIESLVVDDVTGAAALSGTYDGTWNASTNSPMVTSGVGAKGHYRIVSTEGATTIDGISNWQVGDWIIFNGSAWERIRPTDTATALTITGTNGIVVTKVGANVTIDINWSSGLSAWMDTLPTDAASLSAGDWYNNGGIPSRAQ